MLYDIRIVTIDGHDEVVCIWEESNGWDRQRNIRLSITARCPLKTYDESGFIDCNHPTGGVCHFEGEDGDEDGYCPLRRYKE